MNRADAAVSLVIPGRNAAATLRPCLESVTPLLETGELREILFVDDGSTDDTAALVRQYPVRCITSPGGGPGAARNLGWKAAASPWVWFIDADCVAEPDALGRLLARGDDSRVAGVGGSYGNAVPGSFLACLIHQEIRHRHLAMDPEEVDYLGSFNVLYRRQILDRVGGFDESEFNGPGAPGAEDADLSFRIAELGFRLRFEPGSRVGHFHPTRLGRYLRAQRLHGFWATRLYFRHARKGRKNSYSSALDHLQPPLGMAVLVALPTLAVAPLRPLAPLLALALLAAQAPMTLRLLCRTRRWRTLAFAPLGAVRAVARGLGMARGLGSLLAGGFSPPAR